MSESDPSSQTLNCPSLAVVTSMVVSVAGLKHMAVILSLWAAAMVVFSSKLRRKRKVTEKATDGGQKNTSGNAEEYRILKTCTSVLSRQSHRV